MDLSRPLVISDCSSGIQDFWNYWGFVVPKISGIFREKIPEILENVNAINSMLNINGGLQLLQLSSIRYWTLGQLSSQPLTSYCQSVCHSLTTQFAQVA